MQKFYICS